MFKLNSSNNKDLDLEYPSCKQKMIHIIFDNMYNSKEYNVFFLKELMCVNKM